ncbi:MAG: phosphate ABC transporter permease PstA [Fimbriimonadaceae bacterium]|nr:phosphate ABC transporter permease PstA [Fimbriimonadaceae bacterium]
MMVELHERRFNQRRRIKEKLFVALCFTATLIAIIALVALLVKVVRDGAGRLSAEFLTSFPSYKPERAGIKSPLIGTALVVGLTALIGIPIGVAAAVYLEEFQDRKTRLTEFIQVNISNLAGVPSIVYGLLGLAVFVRWMMLGRSILAGALTMALLILPMVIIVSQEALRAVPSAYREGSYALGATRWQTIRRQVLPAAAPGIFTGVILAISRAIGETAPLIVVGAAASANFIPRNLMDSYVVLPLQVFSWSRYPQEAFHQNAAAAIIVLLVALLLLNSVAIYLRGRARR